MLQELPDQIPGTGVYPLNILDEDQNLLSAPDMLNLPNEEPEGQMSQRRGLPRWVLFRQGEQEAQAGLELGRSCLSERDLEDLLRSPQFCSCGIAFAHMSSILDIAFDRPEIRAPA